MKIKIIKQPDFRDTLIAMRLPMNGQSNIEYYDESGLIWYEDKKLLAKLVKAGPDHSKSIRGVWVTIDITAARYWWSEMDTYTIGRQPLSSTSTMYKITSRDLTPDDFEGNETHFSAIQLMNSIRVDKEWTNTEKLIMIKRQLPESFLQRRIVQFNYQSLRNIYKQRKNHRLHEWKQFCTALKDLPYFEEFIFS